MLAEEEIFQKLTIKRDAELTVAEALDAIPERFWKCKLEIPELTVWADAMLRGDELELEGLLLVGPTGVGKTGNLWALYHYIWDVCAELKGDQYLLRKPDDFQIHGVTTLLDSLRPGSVRAISLQDVTNAVILGLDDVGSYKPSEWAEERLYEIVNSRYESCAPTIFTTNLPHVAGVVGDRIASRMAEMCQMIVVNGEDRRRRPKS